MQRVDCIHTPPLLPLILHLPSPTPILPLRMSPSTSNTAPPPPDTPSTDPNTTRKSSSSPNSRPCTCGNPALGCRRPRGRIGSSWSSRAVRREGRFLGRRWSCRRRRSRLWRGRLRSRLRRRCGRGGVSGLGGGEGEGMGRGLRCCAGHLSE